MKFLTRAEEAWLRGIVIPALGIKVSVKIIEDHDYQGKYPDIWTKGYTITITNEWARQSPTERKKRLLHEMIHIAGFPHMPKVGFYSRPERDTFTAKVMRKLGGG